MMTLSAILVIVFILVGIISLILYSILGSVRPSLLNGLNPESGMINEVTKIGTINDARDRFLVPAGATLSVYVYCAVNNKTQGLVSGPEEDIPVIKIGNVLQLKIIPGGVSRPPKTVLSIRTQGPNSQAETIDLIDLPQQKWVQVVIVREGRRFTVYYNGEVAGSQRTQYFPVVNSSQCTIGDKRLRGQFAFPKIAPVPMRIEEVRQDLSETSNTRHEPNLTPFFDKVWFPSISIGCPNGLFCFSTSSPPTNDPLKVWKSPYA
jgi:hypothetical protein